MTRRKDLQPDELQPETPAEPETSPAEPFVTEVETVASAPVQAAVVDPRPEPPPLPPRRGPGFLAPLLGGALAAIGGFALAHFNVFGLAAPVAPVDMAPLVARIDDARSAQAAAVDTLSADLSALSARVAALEAAPAPDLSALSQRLDAIEAMPSDGTASAAALAAKITALEQRIASLPDAGADPALQQKLDDALARLTKAEADATTRAAEAEAAAQASARAKALDTLSQAIATGQPFAVELQALADPALTQALGPAAETGVPTLAALQAAFPDAAREALRLSRDLRAEDGWGARLVDFLATQTGARSLAPLEGDTPDAILSRAEFALSEGRIADALTELDPLDPAAKAPLDAWIAEAKSHLAAAAALQSARGK